MEMREGNMQTLCHFIWAFRIWGPGTKYAQIPRDDCTINPPKFHLNLFSIITPTKGPPVWIFKFSSRRWFPPAHPRHQSASWILTWDEVLHLAKHNSKWSSLPWRGSGMPQLPGWGSAPGGVAVETKVSTYNKFQTQQHKVALETSPKLRDGWCREGRERKRGCIRKQEAGVLFLRHLTGNTTAHSTKAQLEERELRPSFAGKGVLASQQPFLTPTQGSLLFSKNPTERLNAQCETQAES